MRRATGFIAGPVTYAEVFRCGAEMAAATAGPESRTSALAGAVRPVPMSLDCDAYLGMAVARRAANGIAAPGASNRRNRSIGAVEVESKRKRRTEKILLEDGKRSLSDRLLRQKGSRPLLSL